VWIKRSVQQAYAFRFKPVFSFCKHCVPSVIYTVRSLIKLNATVTSRLPAGTVVYK
jgi:hypothetical protein